MNADQGKPTSDARIEIIPYGPVETLALSVVAANLQAVLGLNTDVAAARPEPDFAFIPQRRQFDAMKIIPPLAGETDGVRLRLGVTELDICTPILTFVFGESQLGGTSAVISLHRLAGAGREKKYERAAKIAVHEVGHILGLGHCWDIRCLMHFSRNIEQLDQLPLLFCQACEFEAGRRIRNLAENRLRAPGPRQA